ncbi:C39 family peptidase [Rummeliibacillus pycnus]|uniref:C39 family peptidase n=1 Tax=Rummeliibacillus pycnus TaxID=101070 RepID=UPI000C9A7159|nr:C39 family peptidase [Rummeliibacillus pycnus]
MRIQLPVEGQSQYATSVNRKYQNSACGPTTAYVLLQYLQPEKRQKSINQLYQLLGCTRIGLFSYRMVRNMKKILGPSFEVRNCSLNDALKEIEAGRPAIMKFDRYFSLHFFFKGDFNYHWVPLIGFEKTDDDILLIIHDNGGRNRDSQIREISYQKNCKIVSFIRIAPK